MSGTRELALALVLGACAAPRPVVFQGQPESPVVGAEEVSVASAVPREATRLGTLSARCAGGVEWEPFERRLSDVDCTEQRLERMLREAAAEYGGDVLAKLECGQGEPRTCRATLARLRRTPTALSTKRRSPDVRSSLGASVRVVFEPRLARLELAPRAEEAVRDLPVAPPSHVVVGSLETSCDADCDELSVRDALRIAAGRLGMADVAGVRCLAWSGGHRCVGEGLVSESDVLERTSQPSASGAGAPNAP